MDEKKISRPGFIQEYAQRRKRQAAGWRREGFTMVIEGFMEGGTWRQGT